MDQALNRLAASRRVIVLLLAAACLLFEAPALTQHWSRSLVGQDGIIWSRTSREPTVEAIRDVDSGHPSPARAAGLQPGDVVLEIVNARGTRFPIHGVFDHGSALRSIHYGESWQLLVVRPGPDGTGQQVLRLVAPPAAEPAKSANDWLVILSNYLLLPLLTISAGVLVGLARPADDQAFLAALLLFALPGQFTLASEGLPHPFRLFVVVAASLSASFQSYLFFRFFLRFPSPSPLDRRLPWLNPVLFWATLGVAAYRLVAGLSIRLSFAMAYAIRSGLDALHLAGALDALSSNLPLVTTGLGLVALVLNTWRPDSPAEQRRMLLIFSGALISFVPLGLYLLVLKLAGESLLWLALLVALTIWVFPACFVYAILRHRVFGIRVIVRRGLQYALVTRGFVVAGLVMFFFLYTTFGPVVERLLPRAGGLIAPLGSAAVALGLASGLRHLNRRFAGVMDRAFLREAYDARRILGELSTAVREQAPEPDRMLSHVARTLHAALHPTHVSVYLRADQARALLRSAGTPVRAPGGFCCALVSCGDGNAFDDPVLLPDRAVPPEVTRALDRAAAGSDVLVIEESRPASPWISMPEGTPDKPCDSTVSTRVVVRLATQRSLLGFLVLGDKLSEEPYSRDDRELLVSIAGQTAVALDYSRLIGQAAERERVRRELEIAQEVQAQLFPQVRPPLASLEYIGVSLPARILGGDYYDFVPLGEGRLGLALADLSGKGLSAALLMASLQGGLRSHASQWGEQPKELAADLNGQLCASSGTNRFATFFYGVYDDATRRLTYVNAGHNPPLVVRPAPVLVETPRGGGAQSAAASPGADPTGWVPAGEALYRRLTIGGMVIGLFPDRIYEQESVQLQSGDLLVAYSDGLVDVENPAGEPFGEQRLIDLLAANGDLPPDDLRELVFSQLTRFAAGVAFEDDVTLIVARVR